MDTPSDTPPSITKVVHNCPGVMAQLRRNTHDLDDVSTLLPRTA